MTPAAQMTMEATPDIAIDLAIADSGVPEPIVVIDSGTRVTATLSRQTVVSLQGGGLLLNISPESSDCLPAYSCAGHRAASSIR